MIEVWHPCGGGPVSPLEGRCWQRQPACFPTSRYRIRPGVPVFHRVSRSETRQRRGFMWATPHLFAACRQRNPAENPPRAWVQIFPAQATALDYLSYQTMRPSTGSAVSPQSQHGTEKEITV